MAAPSFIRRTTWAALASLALAALSGSAWAQADRSVKFILPNATGSGVDAITRAAQVTAAPRNHHAARAPPLA